jgi:hypothetical protein
MCTVKSITGAKISHLRNYKYEVNPSIGVDKSQVTVNCTVAQRLKVYTIHETCVIDSRDLFAERSAFHTAAVNFNVNSIYFNKSASMRHYYIIVTITLSSK